MKYRFKLLIDRYLGSVLCFATAPFVRLVDLSRASQPPPPVKHIAVTKILGMGSILQSQQMVRAFRTKYPDAKITLITSHANRAMTFHLKEMFDDYFFIRDHKVALLAIDTLRVIWWSWKSKIDLYLDLEIYSAFTAFLCGISLIPQRYGFYRNIIAYRSWLHTHLTYFNCQKHISETYLQLALPFGKNDHDSLPNPFGLHATVLAETQSWLYQHSIKDAFFLINVNASELMLERRWPAKSFSQLIEKLIAAYQIPVVLIGSPTERNYVETIRFGVAPAQQRHVFNSAGEVSLGGCLGLIQNCTLIVTNDSGPFHFAVAMKKRIVGLFGPCHPQQYGILQSNEKIKIQYEDVYCSPCIHNTFAPPCNGDNICMKQISVDAVLRDIEQLCSGR